MKTLNILLVIGMITAGALSPASVLAGSRTASGGSVLVCPNGQTSLLDYIRAKYEWQLEITPAEGKDEFERAKEIIQRISWLDRSRAIEYQNIVKFIQESARFENESVGFQSSDDQGKYSVCADARVVQVIRQVEPHYPEDVRYRINKPVWDQLDLDTRAGLLVHEAILTEKMATTAGAVSMDDVAYFNGYITSGQFLASNDVRDYYARLGSVKLFNRGYLARLIGIVGVWGSLGEEDRADDTVILSAKLARVLTVDCDASRIEVPVTGRIDVKSDLCEDLRQAVQNIHSDEELRLTFVHHNNMIWSPRSRVEGFRIAK